NNLEDHDRARALYQESLHLSTSLNSSNGIAAALIGLGMVATSEGAYDDAEDFLRRGLAAYQDTGSPVGLLPGIYAYGRLDIARGDYDAAERRFTEDGRLWDVNYVGFRTYLSLELAQLERYRGNETVATQLVEHCLVLF